MEKMDRRVRKTRALLLQGLVKMMETHDIQDISVKELTRTGRYQSRNLLSAL